VPELTLIHWQLHEDAVPPCWIITETGRIREEHVLPKLLNELASQLQKYENGVELSQMVDVLSQKASKALDDLHTGCSKLPTTA